MTYEEAENIRGFVAEDGNESFRPRIERECPECHTDRKTLTLAVVTGSYEDRVAAGCVIGSCPACEGAIDSLLFKLQLKREDRRYKLPTLIGTK